MNYWLHLGNILYVCAYLVRDILWLRVLTVVATLCLMPYYFCCSDQPLLGPIGWCSLFTAINIVQIVMLVMERRPVFLGEEELQIYNRVFRSLTPREFMKLIGFAEHKRAAANQVLLQQGQPVEQLILISKGSGQVQIDGRHVAQVNAGQFVGEMGFLTRDDASATIIASVPSDYYCWPAKKLRNLFEENPQLSVKMQGVFGVDLIGKLRQRGMATAHPSRMMDIYQQGGGV